MKRAITTILSYITMTAVLLLGFGDILLLPENTGELPRISHFASVPIAFADGGLGTGDGGPNWTGQGVCMTSGQIFTGIIEGNDAGFFCCTTNADCGSYGELYSGGRLLPSVPTCYTGETAALYCPLVAGTGQTFFINKSVSSLSVDLFAPIQYTIQASMTGYGSATNTIIFDTFAPGFVFSGFVSVSPGYTSGSVSGDLMTWSIGTMTSGFAGALVYEGYYTTTGIKTNTAEYRSCPGGTCDDFAVTTVLHPILTIQKYVIIGGSVYTGPILNGMTGSYRIIISNIGSGNARDMSVLDALPAFFTYQGSTVSTGLTYYDTGLHSLAWDTFTLAAGSSLQWSINGTRTISASGVITNFAEIENTGYCTVSGGNCTAQVSSLGLVPVTGQCNTSVMTGYYSGINSLPSTGSLCVSGTLSGLVQVASGWTWSCIGSNSGGSQNSCSLQIRYCGDTSVQSGEQCDDGNTTGGDGCSMTCQYEAPSCALTLSPNAGIAPLLVTGSWLISGWMTALSIDWGDTSSDLFPSSPLAHTYTTTGIRTVSLLIKNNLSGSTLTGLCTGLVTISAAAITGSCGTLSGDIQYDFNNPGDSIHSGTVGLCNVGIVSGFVYNTGAHTWQWSCYGIHSGANVSCNASERYCGDGLAGTGNGYSNQEQCDDGNNTSGDGCSALCQYETPSCTITLLGSGFLPVNATGVRSLPSRITATQLNVGNGNTISNPTSPASMYYGTAGNYTVTLSIQSTISGSTLTGQCTGLIQILGPPVTGQCNTSVMTGYYSGINSLPSTGSLCTSGTLSGLAQVASGWSWSCIGSNSGGSESSCSLQIRYCGDTSVQSGEQCDDGNTTGGDGCSMTCQYEAPSCALTLSPNAGIAPLLVTGSWVISGWMTALSIDWGDTTSDLFPSSPLAHIYTTTGIRTVSVLIKNNLSGSTLTGLCTGLVTISAAAITGSCGTLSGDIQYDFNNSGDSIHSGSVGLCNVGIVSGFVYNTGAHTWQWSCYGIHSGANVSCNASERYCGDGLAGTGNGYSNQEQCDDGNTTSGDGCSATCQYEAPSCTITLTPNAGSVPLLVTGVWSLSGWVSGLSLDRGDSNIDITPSSPLAHIYTTTGIRTVSLLIKNNLSGSTLTGLCTGLVTISAAAITGSCGTLSGDTQYDFNNSGDSIHSGSVGLCNVGIVSGFVYNTGAHTWQWSCYGIHSGANVSCNASERYCGDGLAGTGNGYSNQEQCDDGNTTSGDGCSATCQYEAPSCTITILGSGFLPVNATGVRSLPSRITATQLNLGNGNTISNPTSPASMYYGTAGNYTVTLSIQSTISGSMLTGQCTGIVQVGTSVNAQCNTSVMTGYYSGVNTLPSQSILCTVGSLYGLSQYDTGWSRNCAGVGSGSSQSGCALSISSCGDGVLQSGHGEQCDTQTGCNNMTCQRYTGNCNQVVLQVTPSSGSSPLATTALFSIPLGFQATALDRGDNFITNTPSSGVMHTYNTTGLFIVSLSFDHLGLSGSQFTCLTSVATTSTGNNNTGSNNTGSNNTGSNNTGSNNTGTNTGGGGGSSQGVMFESTSLPTAPMIGNNPNHIPWSPPIISPPTNPNTTIGVIDLSSFVGIPDVYPSPPISIPIESDPSGLLLIDLSQYDNPQSPTGPPSSPITSPLVTSSPPSSPNNTINSSSQNNTPAVNQSSSTPSFTTTLGSIDLYALEQSQDNPYVFIPGVDSSRGGGSSGPNTKSISSLTNFSLGLNSLEYLYRCQGTQFGTATLQACIQQLPYDTYCTVIEKKNNRISINKPRIRQCIKQVDEYFSPYNEVPGALYLDLDLKLDREKSQLIISFLSQFLTIYSYKAVLEPYEPFVMRLEFDPQQIDNAGMYGLLAHLGGDELAQHIVPVPLFKIAQQTKSTAGRKSSPLLLSQNTTSSQAGSTPLFTVLDVVNFSDPLYDKQTYLDTIGFEQSLGLCSRNPTKEVSVAIIDSAFDLSHEDLQKNIIFQKDVANDDNDVAPPPDQLSNVDWAHGTYSAGIIAATTDNNKGLISIPLNSLKVSVYKATRDDAASPSDITYGLEALTQAGRTQPDVINVSWGIFSNDDIPILKRLVTKISKQGTTIIASAGNYNSSAPFYPAAYPEVIAVGAVDNNKQKASFSNHGGRVDIAAPGVDIITTSMDNLYESVDGTSEAAPVVSAGLAYILGHGGSIDDIFDNLSPILADLGKGVMDLEKACTAMAATYNPDGNGTAFQPPSTTKDPAVNFATQSNPIGFDNPLQLMLLLLILILLLMLRYMWKQIRRIDKK